MKEVGIYPDSMKWTAIGPKTEGADLILASCDCKTGLLGVQSSQVLYCIKSEISSPLVDSQGTIVPRLAHKWLVFNYRCSLQLPLSVPYQHSDS